MIFYRYLALHIHKGAALVLTILVSLSLFFTLIQELDDLGTGQYGMRELIQYLWYRMPSYVVDFMPLAALLGSILSLGNLASSSELIAFHSSGVSIRKFTRAVSLAAFILALVSFLVSDFIVPYAETRANDIKASSLASRVSMHSRQGVWIKDEGRVIFIERLFPDGNARNIQISQLDEKGNLIRSLTAKQAIAQEQGWLLRHVRQTEFNHDGVSITEDNQLLYKGHLSDQLLTTLVVEPDSMSVIDLVTYIDFLKENKMSHAPESLSLWQKIYSPIIIIVMSLLALPFVLGSQRLSNSGQRIMTGILLGLSYIVINRLLIQLGEQINLLPVLNALMPTLIFITILIVLFRAKLIKI